MIDSAVQDFVSDSERFYPPDAASLPLREQRRLYGAYARSFTLERSAQCRSEDASLVVDGGRQIPLRLYSAVPAPRGLICYAHGGGFILGSLDSHDGIVARIADLTGCAVIAIDYRLAPEHPAPAAHDDVRAVLEAALDGALPWSGLASLAVALMGDSAGATLAAAAALRVNRGRPGAVRALGLVYPALGFEPAEPARSVEAEAPMLTLTDVRFYRSVYLADQDPPPACFVLDEPDLSALPPTVLLPAEHDPLRDDCTELARHLQSCGTEVLLLPGTGLVHGCLRAIDRAPAVAAPFALMLRFVAEHLSVDATSP